MRYVTTSYSGEYFWLDWTTFMFYCFKSYGFVCNNWIYAIFDRWKKKKSKSLKRKQVVFRLLEKLFNYFEDIALETKSSKPFYV